MNAPADRLLRRSLQLDGAASGVCGVLLLAVASPLSPVIGLADLRVARVVGALLVVYAAALLWNGARARVSRAEAVAAVVLNVGWVLGSAAVILAGPLIPTGNVAVAAVAVFAALEVGGLTRRSGTAG